MPQIRHEDQKKQPTFALPAPPAPRPEYPVRGGPLSKLGGLGRLDLNEYPAVESFQIMFNLLLVNSTALPAGRRITGSRITVDGKYASETQGALERLITWYVREGMCTDTSAANARANGPNGVRGCLIGRQTAENIGSANAWVDQLQQAWREWKIAIGAIDVGDGGGGTVTPPPSGGGGGGGGGGTPTPRSTTKKAGWFGGLLIGLDALVGSVLAASSKRWK